MPPTCRSARTFAVPKAYYEPESGSDDTASSKASREEDNDSPFSDNGETEESSPTPSPSISPLKRKVSKRLGKATVVEEVIEQREQSAASNSAKRKRKQSNTNIPQESAEEDMKGGAKRRKTMRKAPAVVSGDADLVGDGIGQEADPETTKPKARKKKIAPPQDAATGESPKKRKPRAPKPEPVYVIPDVERLETTFHGRLGYACLNTVLRSRKPASDAVFCSRTCRIDTIKQNGLEWVKELGRKNMEDMKTMIRWNEENNIHFMRMSSEMFPFASHGKYGYSLDYCADLLKEVGDLAKSLGHRLTTHPGQFNQLGSPKPEVIESSIRDLEYHAQMLDLMGLGPDSVMIIHGGGVYGDKPATLERIKKTIREKLPPQVRSRLVLENDEMCYSASDLLPLCEELSIPLVFDYHHDNLLPSNISRAEVIARANAIFAKRGIKPKQHLSEPRPGTEGGNVLERRAHSDRCQRLPGDLPDDMDLMIEAKDKEQAVFHLYRIYNLQPVVHANLRPPAEVETKETKGRKSNKKKVAAAAQDEEMDAEAAEDGGVVRRRGRKKAAAAKTESGKTGEQEKEEASPSLSPDDAEVKMKQEEIRAGARALDPGVRLDAEAEPDAEENGQSVHSVAAGSTGRRRSTRRKKSLQ